MNLSALSNMSLAGFITILVLGLLSVMMVALGWELHKRQVGWNLNGDWLLAQLRFLLFDKGVDKSEARAYLKELDRPVALICSELLAFEEPNLERGDYLLAAVIDRHRLKLESGLSHLGTIAVIAPFVGLFGTVVGITKTFADVAKEGKAGIEIVSAGVSEALVATAIGLLVAIVSVVLFNLFKKRFETETTEWDITARHLLTLLLYEDSESAPPFSSISGSFDTKSAEQFLSREKQP